MRTMGEKDVGRFKVEIEVSNNDDVSDARRGIIDSAKVRRQSLLGVVDSGAAHLVLPQKIADELGLVANSKVKVRYANGKTSTRPRVENVYLELQGRHGIFSAILEPKRDTALIGAIVLEEMDFLVDCTNSRLYPRDPKMVISEIE
jgi:predicted aspartyl protease